MEEHELRQMLTLNVHNAKRELKKLCDDWVKTVREDVKVNQNDVDEFKEVANKVNELSMEFENEFLKYMTAKQQFEERKKMESHRFNVESIAILSKLFIELKKVDDVLEDSSGNYYENNTEYMDEKIDVSSVIQSMEEFLALIKK